jgi:hypothetical protein
MAQIVTKFIADNAVDDTKVRLQNQGWLRARNQANSADVDIVEVDASNTIQFGSVPQTPSAPVATNDVTNKNYVDQVATNLLDQEKSEVITLMSADITNGYITLANAAFLDSVEVIAGGVGQYLGIDYTLSTPGLYTVVTFLTPLTSILAAGDVLSVNYNVAISVTNNGPVAVNLLNQVAVINNTVASGNGGGATLTPGTWNTRVLDTVQAGQPWLSLASNQFTLAAGTYEIEGSCAGFYVAVHQSRIQNITDSTTAIIGTGEYANSGTAAQTRTFVDGVITISAPKTFEFQHYPQLNADGQQGGGVAVGFAGFDVYSQLKISKLSPTTRFDKSLTTGSFPYSSSLVQILDSGGVNPISASVVATGAEVEVGLQDDGNGVNPGGIFVDHTPTDSNGVLYFYRDGVPISAQQLYMQNNVSIEIMGIPSSCFRFIDTPPAGPHTYTAYIQGQTNRGDQVVYYTVLYARAF